MKTPVATIDSLKNKYERLESGIVPKSEHAIDPSCLPTFEYEYASQPSQVSIDTEEFTAICPWTRLPDFGTLAISYTPAHQCIELKSLKYYLLTYRDVGIVQEHAANRILRDLVSACQPRYMKVALDYRPRGGLHTSVSVEYNADKAPEGQGNR